MSRDEHSVFGREFGRNVTNEIVKKSTAPKSPVPQPNINRKAAPISLTHDTVTTIMGSRSISTSDEIPKRRRVEYSLNALSAKPMSHSHLDSNEKVEELNDSVFSVESCFDEDLGVQRSPSVSAKLLDAVDVSERAVMRGLCVGELSPSLTPPPNVPPVVTPMLFTLGPTL